MQRRGFFNPNIHISNSPPLLCMQCYRAFILLKMRYEGKFIKHKATKHSPKWNEIVANVEFSEGDLMELQKILYESKSTWGIELMIEIEKSFQHRDSLNAI